MGKIFGSKKTRDEPAKAADDAGKRQRDLEDAWRADRNAVIPRLRAAEQTHARARQTYDRYAPGAQRDAAGADLNAAADRLAEIEREFATVDTFSAWRNR